MRIAARLALAGTAFVLLGAAGAAYRAPLTIVSTSPQGEVASLADAAEIRIEFSEPMVPLGRAPASVTAPFFQITPAVTGTFRWSGTTTLVFTPAAPLPFATRYSVTITTAATSAAGNKLAAPSTFTFTTPTVRLQGAEWYRQDGQVAAPVVVAVRFNQPVEPATIARSLQLRYVPHDWDPPAFTDAARARLQATAPAALAAFDRKVAATRAVTQRSDAIAFDVASDWDRDRFPAADTLVVLRSRTPPPPQSWIAVNVLRTARGRGGAAQPPEVQSYTLQVEEAFFVKGFECHRQCDPSAYNRVIMTAPARVVDVSAAMAVTDVTAAPQAVARATVPRPREDADVTRAVSLEDAGFRRQPPARTFAVSLAPTLRAADGQTLGYQWLGVVENWHETAFTSFGDGHGVWERSGGAVLPFSARNIQRITQWVRRISVGELMARVMEIAKHGGRTPPAEPGTPRTLQVRPDEIQAHGLDLSGALGSTGTGLVMAAIRDGAPIARSAPLTPGATKATLVQVTNLGITVKDAPQGTLLFVTRLDDGAPVPGASVSLVGTNEQVAWRGTTAADGVAIAPVGLRSPDRTWELAFIAVAEKDGDVAYAASDWNEGVSPWEFGINFDPRPPTGSIRGAVFTDRGVYRLGESLHVKTILRRAQPGGMALLPQGTQVTAVVRDSRSREIDRRTVALSRWSSAEWTFAVPAAGTLGDYSIEVELPDPAAPAPPPPSADEYRPDYSHLRKVHGTFLVAAYRRPDFSVDASLDPTGTAPVMGGVTLNASARGQYLFGASMGGRPIRWNVTRRPVFRAPDDVHERYPERQWEFVGYRREPRYEAVPVRSAQESLAANGSFTTQIPTERAAGLPYQYTFEAEVEDVSRQRIAGRATQLVHPAPWYLGVRQTNRLLEAPGSLSSAVVAVSPAGAPVAGVPVTVTLNKVQWHSVRRAEGNGFYTWHSEERITPVSSTRVTSSTDPVPVSFTIPEGGSYEVVASATDADGRIATTEWQFYAYGDGYTAWQRYDHQRIDLVPEKQTWKPGESARLMIQSPWETATALVTMERERVRSHRTFRLTSTQQTIEVPITEADVPNVYVSVLLVKGRTATDPGRDGSDPGKPAFRLGYAEFKVDDSRKKLDVRVTANRAEYRPASEARVNVEVRDAAGRGTPSEVTLWAVDEGVLQLTGFNPPDVIASVYQHEPLQVMTSDSRERIVSRRVLTPKGSTEGGGGGIAADLRRDFRVLAFWLGSLETGSNGRASTQVKLPESMTSYRIMAVAADAQSRFGSGRATIRVNRPVTLRPVLPRFLTPGDRAMIGAAVTNTLSRGGNATVTIESADPSRLRIDSARSTRVPVGAGATVNVPFEATALAPGDARVRVSVRLNGESDGFEMPIPVGITAPWETVATHGQTADRAAIAIEAPAGALPNTGALRLDLASTALVGLNEGARYLVEYPYGCIEQRASRTLALILAADLGGAFTLEGLASAELRARAQASIDELLAFQCAEGGFAFWPGQCWSRSPYLSSYVAHVLQTAAALGYRAGVDQLDQTYTYLEQALTGEGGPNAAWMTAYTAWQAFTVRALVKGKRPQDAAITRLFGLVDRMPVFALSFLADAMRGSNPADPRLTDVERRIRNAIRAESASAHVDELDDPELYWLWSSNTRTTAIVMAGLIERGVAGDLAPRMARYLLDARENGRWDNTQENAWALNALVTYYRAFENVTPDFSATAAIGSRVLAAAEFRGRSTTSVQAAVPLSEILAAIGAGARDLVLEKQGAGMLFFGARMRYQVDPLAVRAQSNGFTIERRYEPFVEGGAAPAAASYAAGDLVRVVLTITAPAERRFVAVTDPLPAGFEAVEGWFATTASDLAREASVGGPRDADARRGGRGGGDWFARMQRGGFDYVEKFDDRVQLFATRLGDGRHEFSYLVRATTSGTFLATSAWVEQMYEPEVNGRTAPAKVEVRK